MKDNNIKIELVKNEDEIEHSCTDEVVCPWCGYKYQDSFELDDSGTEICPECWGDFKYDRIVTVDYSTKRN